jgi:Abnormal spindle-like microcephaly-assoc'd, ASPM-SPD-2-Hydin
VRASLRVGTAGSPALAVLVGTLALHAGAAAARPRLFASDAAVPFRARPVWTRSRARVVEVCNPGPGSVRVHVAVAGAGFRLDRPTTTCARVPALLAGEQCAVGVQFAPTRQGRAHGAATVTGGAGRVLARIQLDGTALAEEAPHLFVVAVRPAQLRFGRHAVGTRSAPQLVTVSNPEAQPVVIRRVRLAGTSPGNFRIGRQTCTGTLLGGRSCDIRVRFAPRFVAVRTATLQIVVASPHRAVDVALSGRGASSVPSRPDARFTLAGLDRSCFYAPSSPGRWPVAPTGRPHAVRGGFNDPRGRAQAHFGVDVAAHNIASGLAVRSGFVDGIASVGNAADEHFVLESSDGVSRYVYYHVRPRLSDGTRVAGGEALGTIEPGFKHVHLSEIVARCGLVDPRRPTGILRDPADTEAPSIGTLQAYRADRAAYAPFPLDRPPGRGGARQLPLDDLRGVVDMRAEVSDTPRHATVQWPQQTLMAAGVRSFLAPVGREGRHYGRVITAFDGSRLIDPTHVFRVFAHGTYRLNGCFFSHRPCASILRLHVAGSGFDTREFANGNYLYCVSAITIRGRTGHRCTPVTIRN